MEFGPRAFATALSALGRWNCRWEGVSLWGHFRERKAPVDQTVYLAVMTPFARRGERKQVLVLLEAMAEDAVRPDIQVYTTLVQTCVRTHQIPTPQRAAEAEQLLKTMRIGQIPPDTAIMNAVLSTKRGFGAAGKLLARMYELYVPPDEITYATVVACCAPKKQVSEARQATLEAMRQGLSSATLWQNLLRVYQHADDLEGLRRVWRKMQREAIQPTLLAYVAYIRALTKRVLEPGDEHVQEAEALLREAVEALAPAEQAGTPRRPRGGTPPLSQLYADMVELYAQAGDEAAAVRLISEAGGDIAQAGQVRKALRRRCSGAVGD